MSTTSKLATILVDRLITVTGDRARADEQGEISRREIARLTAQVDALQDSNSKQRFQIASYVEKINTLIADRSHEAKKAQLYFNALANLCGAAADFLTRVESKPSAKGNVNSGEATELRDRIAEARKIYDGEIPF